MFSGCPFTGTRVIPGRSTIVRSGTPDFFTWRVKGVSETPLPDPAAQVCSKYTLKRWNEREKRNIPAITSVAAQIASAMCSSSVETTLSLYSSQISGSGLELLWSLITRGTLVQIPCPRGKLIPAKDSRTLLPRGLVSNHNNGGKLDPFSHHIQVPQPVDSVKQRPDPIIVRRYNRCFNGNNFVVVGVFFDNRYRRRGFRDNFRLTTFHFRQEWRRYELEIEERGFKNK